MAMAALGDPHRYIDDFRKMLREDLVPASHKPPNQPVGARIPGKDPVHPYLDPWYRKGQESEQERFDMAASLQQATEELAFELVKESLDSDPSSDSLCISGGVALNSVMIGKIQRSFQDRISNVYVPPIPYDGGLCLGASQFVFHQKLGNPRITWSDNFTPFLGEIYSDAVSVVDNTPGVTKEECDDFRLVDLLDQGKILAVFNGGSESGRRALGNRSILADPRDPTMKDKINQKVKHRQWFRPFAPSILRARVGEWFEEDVDSPYMTHVIFFKSEVRERVPAVVHFDGSARVQTVTELDNPWYHRLLSLWESKTGVPILLNSSANDTEPINENPKHMMDLLLRTEIDHVYFVQDKILVTRKEVS
jgi:carbamoyltransferase